MPWDYSKFGLDPTGQMAQMMGQWGDGMIPTAPQAGGDIQGMLQQSMGQPQMQQPQLQTPPARTLEPREHFRTLPWYAKIAAILDPVGYTEGIKERNKMAMAQEEMGLTREQIALRNKQFELQKQEQERLDRQHQVFKEMDKAAMTFDLSKTPNVRLALTKYHRENPEKTSNWTPNYINEYVDSFTPVVDPRKLQMRIDGQGNVYMFDIRQDEKGEMRTNYVKGTEKMNVYSPEGIIDMLDRFSKQTGEAIRKYGPDSQQVGVLKRMRDELLGKGAGIPPETVDKYTAYIRSKLMKGEIDLTRKRMLADDGMTWIDMNPQQVKLVQALTENLPEKIEPKKTEDLVREQKSLVTALNQFMKQYGLDIDLFSYIMMPEDRRKEYERSIGKDILSKLPPAARLQARKMMDRLIELTNQIGGVEPTSEREIYTEAVRQAIRELNEDWTRDPKTKPATEKDRESAIKQRAMQLLGNR